MNSEVSRLLEAVDVYLDAIHYCDVEKLDEVFHPAASLFDADDGSVLADPIASFREDVRTRPSPSSINQTRHEEIIAIDWLSEVSAVVKLRLQAHENVFVDHLSFVLGDGSWTIVAKVWHLEATAEITNAGGGGRSATRRR